MLELNKIYNEDCVKGMDQIEKETIDLIIADPPYGISTKNNFATMKDRKNHRTGTYFGDWDKNFSNKEWIEKSFDLLKRGGSLIVFYPFSKATRVYNLAISSGYIYKDTLIWHKTNPMPRNRDRRYVQNIEMAQWYVKKGNKWTFNRQDPKYESCIFSCPSESGGGFKRYHPTQKPVRLIKHFIKIHSNPGDKVLDPFMGSGTTAVAALNTGRKYIGFELDKHYFDLAEKRLELLEGSVKQ